jgi:hypothetical protein
MAACRPVTLSLSILLITALAGCEKLAGPATSPGFDSAATPEVLLSDSIVPSGSTTRVMLLMRDENGRALTATGLDVTFLLEGGTSSGSLGQVEDHGDGSYSATLTGLVAGSPTVIHALLGGAPIGSSRELRVIPGPPAASRSSLEVSASEIEVGQNAMLVLRTRDANGNPLTTGGLTVAFTAVGYAAGALGTAIDHGDGSYSCMYVPTGAGHVALHAAIGGRYLTSAPLSLTVTDHP